MGRKLLINNPNKDKIIKDLCDIINKAYKDNKIDKKIEPSDMYKRLEDPKVVDRYKKSNELLDEVEEKHQYSKQLTKKYNLEINKGFVRHAHLYLNIPKGTEEEKQKIEKENADLLKRLSNPETAKEETRNQLKNVYECDKGKLLCTNFDDAYEIYKNNSLLVETSFVIQSIVQNQTIAVNDEMIENFNYNKKIIEMNNCSKEYILGYASEMSLLLPDDMPLEERGLFLAEFSKYEEKHPEDMMKDGSIQNYSNLSNKERDDKVIEKLKDIYEKHDKDHQLLYTKGIGGETFYEQLKSDIKNGKEPEFKNFYGNTKDSILFGDFIEGKTQNNKQFEKRNKVIEEIRSGKLTEAEFDKKFLDKEGNFRENKRDDYLLYCAMARTSKDKAFKNVVKTLDIYSDMAKVTKEDIKEAQNKYKEKASFLEGLSLDELKDKAKEFNCKDDPERFFSIAKQISENNKKRGFFNRIFSKDSKLEKAALKDMKKEALDNGFSNKDFDKLMKGSRKDINKEKLTSINPNAYKETTKETIVKEEKTVEIEKEKTIDVIEPIKDVVKEQEKVVEEVEKKAEEPEKEIEEVSDSKSHTLKESKEIFREYLDNKAIYSDEDIEKKVNLTRSELRRLSTDPTTRDKQLKDIENLSTKRLEMMNRLKDNISSLRQYKNDEPIYEFFSTMGENLYAAKNSKDEDLSKGIMKLNQDAFEKMIKTTKPKVSKEMLARETERAMNIIKNVSLTTLENENNKDGLEYTSMIKEAVKNVDIKKVQNDIKNIDDNTMKMIDKIENIKDKKEEINLENNFVEKNDDVVKIEKEEKQLVMVDELEL